MKVHAGLVLLQGWQFRSQSVTEIDTAAVALQTVRANVPVFLCLGCPQKRQEGYSYRDSHCCVLLRQERVRGSEATSPSRDQWASCWETRNRRTG